MPWEGNLQNEGSWIIEQEERGEPVGETEWKTSHSLGKCLFIIGVSAGLSFLVTWGLKEGVASYLHSDLVCTF